MKSKHIRTIIAVLFIALVWELAALNAQRSGATFAALMPTWGHIFTIDLPGFASFADGALSNDAMDFKLAAGVLLTNSLITIRRVLLGLVIGGIFGVLCGLLIGFQKTLCRMFYPVFKVLRNMPLLALIALFLVWFGGKEEGIVIYIAFGLWVIYCTNTIEAIQTVDPVRVNFAKTLGASQKNIYCEVIIPMIVPNLINATKVALGVAWAVGLGGEFLAAQNGLGRLLIMSQAYARIGRMVIVLILYIVLTSIFDMFVNKASKKLLRWMP